MPTAVPGQPPVVEERPSAESMANLAASFPLFFFERACMVLAAVLLF